MRSFTRTGRIATAVMAATMAILGTCVPPLSASAQQVAPEQGGAFAEPPALDPGYPVPGDGGGKPDKPYEKVTDCVQRNLGENIVLPNKPWGQQYLRIEEVHKFVRAAKGSAGGGMKVAVIDTGVNRHPFFQGRVEGGGDYVQDGENGLNDCDGHGTEVAGIIAGNPNDPQIGFVGVAPDAHILSIRQSSQNYEKSKKTETPPVPPATPGAPDTGQPGGTPPPGNGSTGGQSAAGDVVPAQPGGGGRQQSQGDKAGNLTTLAQAVRRAADAGVQVMNLSVDNCRRADGTISDGERQLQAAIHYAVEHNVVVVAAAGNKSTDCAQNDQPNPNMPQTIVTPPWFANDVLSVAAIDQTGSVAPFSINGPWVSVAAPGTDIISLDPAADSSLLANQTIENGQASFIQGTSFAAPYVAGVVTLVRQQFPQLNAREVMKRMTSTAQHPAAPGGRDQFVGYGVINPMLALTSSLPTEPTSPATNRQQLSSDLPPAHRKDWTPMVVALVGAGGGLAALLVTLFVVHTVRRSRPKPPRKAA